MTAEIAILNRIGVALGADSAVTIGPRADKIWTSADKLFQLSEIDPVGLMVYGNAELLGVPWETIVKTYRTQHGKTSLQTLDQHLESLLAFLRSSPSMFPPQRQDFWSLELALILLLHLRDRLGRRLDDEAERRNGLTEKEIPPLVREETLKLVKALRKQKPISGISAEVRGRLRRRFAEEIEKRRVQVFDKLPMSKKTSRAITSSVVLMWTRQYLGIAKTGVVVAGFGAAEFLPGLGAFEIEAFIDGLPRLKRTTQESTRIDENNESMVIPFAQDDVVHTFMSGIAPPVKKATRRSAEQLFVDTFQAVIDAVSSVAPDASGKLTAIKGQLRVLCEKMFQEWDKAEELHWEPVVRNIATLPKDELAAMAEAFVNLTKFRRRVTTERETVGGPIDVAVITKGDGFVWVRRKHYFDPALNPRFFSRIRP